MSRTELTPCSCMWPFGREICGSLIVHALHVVWAYGIVTLIVIQENERIFVMLTGWKWMAFTMLFTLCSLLSKEQGITAVAVCFSYDIFIEQKVV